MKISDIEKKIQGAYEEGVSASEAEKLAAEFLHYQLKLSSMLKDADLDARMRKTGVKAIRAQVYLNAIAGAEKKPSDVLLEQTVNTDPAVADEQGAYDLAEVNKEELERIYNVCREAHVFFRGVAKGTFS